MVKRILTFLSCMLLCFIAQIGLSKAYANTTATLLPINDGFYAQWTPKSGTTHFTMVDETTCNGQTDYNSTTTVGNRDSYGVDVSSIPNGATITQIDITPCASRVSNGATNPAMNVFYRLNGIDGTDSGSYTLTGLTPIVLSTTSFTGLSAVKASTSALEIGAVLTSGTKGARLSQIATVITYTPLTTPSGLMVSAGTEAANLSWTDNSTNEDGFKIERSTNGVNYTEIGSVSANVTSFTDANIAGFFFYRVRAYNSGGFSSYSNVASVSISLVAPTNLAGSPSGSDALLNWIDNSMAEDGFKIERSTNSANFFQQIATVGANMTSYTDPGLLSGTYFYRVRAYKSATNSGYSNTISVTIP